MRSTPQLFRGTVWTNDNSIGYDTEEEFLTAYSANGTSSSITVKNPDSGIIIYMSAGPTRMLIS